MAYTQKNVAKVLAVRNSSLHGSRMFSFSMPLSVEVGVSVAAYSELFDESKSTFSQNSQVYSFSLIQWHRNKFFHIV